MKETGKAVHSVFDELIVRVAVEPSFTRLGRGNNRVVSGVCMLCCVTVHRGVATQRRAALLTCAQMNPLVPCLDAFLTYLTLRCSQRRNFTDVRTRWMRHEHYVPSLRDGPFFRTEADRASEIIVHAHAPLASARTHANVITNLNPPRND